MTVSGSSEMRTNLLESANTTMVPINTATIRGLTLIIRRT